MIKKLYLPLVALLVLALSSCGKMGELSSDYFTTNPEVLEAIGGKVPVTINGKFPEKYMKKKATVEVTPVLRWKGGEAKGQPAVFHKWLTLNYILISKSQKAKRHIPFLL